MVAWTDLMALAGKALEGTETALMLLWIVKRRREILRRCVWYAPDDVIRIMNEFLSTPVASVDGPTSDRYCAGPQRFSSWSTVRPMSRAILRSNVGEISRPE